MKRKRILICLVFGLAVSMLVPLVTANSVLSMISRPEDQNGTPAEVSRKDPDVLNLLLIGTDDRHETYKDDSSADCILVCSINSKSRKIRLVSLYRNIGTEVSGGPEKGTTCRLNHIFGLGGEKMLTDTVNTDYGLDISDYIRVNMPSVAKTIDLLGGVDIELSAEEADYMNNRNPEMGYKDNEYVVTRPVHEGHNRMDGKTAVVYARGRNMEGGDLKRTGRLRTVVDQMLQKAKTASSETVTGIINEVLPEIKTSLSNSEILNLTGSILPEIKSYSLEQLQIPENGDYNETENQDGISVYEIDHEKYRQKIEDFLYPDSF